MGCVSSVSVGHLSHGCSYSWNGPALSSCELYWCVYAGAGQARVWAASQLPQQVQVHDYCTPRTWFQWICFGGLMKTAWGASELITGIATVEAELRAVPATVYSVSSHNGWQVTQYTHQWTAPAEEYSLAPLPVGAFQSWLLHNTAQNQTRGLYSNNQGADPALGRAVTVTEQRGDATGSGHHNTSYTSYQADNGQHTVRKEVTGIHTKNSPCTINY